MGYQNKCKDPSHPSHYPSHKFPNGAKCEKDSQCASGDCHKGDGPFKNICKDHKSNGQSCSKDADCASGDCHKGAGTTRTSARPRRVPRRSTRRPPTLRPTRRISCSSSWTALKARMASASVWRTTTACRTERNLLCGIASTTPWARSSPLTATV